MVLGFVDKFARFRVLHGMEILSALVALVWHGRVIYRDFRGFLVDAQLMVLEKDNPTDIRSCLRVYDSVVHNPLVPIDVFSVAQSIVSHIPDTNTAWCRVPSSDMLACPCL